MCSFFRNSLKVVHLLNIILLENLQDEDADILQMGMGDDDDSDFEGEGRFSSSGADHKAFNLIASGFNRMCLSLNILNIW